MGPRVIVVAGMLTGLAVAAAPHAWAQETVPSPAQSEVLVCLEQMGFSTSWPQCAGLLFQPCADEEIGSEGHVACLSGERASWKAAMDVKLTALIARLTSEGAFDLTQLMGGWVSAMTQNCGEVARSKGEGSARDAAGLGCEISEIAGVMAEFRACEAGLSTAPYCVFQE